MWNRAFGMVFLLALCSSPSTAAGQGDGTPPAEKAFRCVPLGF